MCVDGTDLAYVVTEYGEQGSVSDHCRAGDDSDEARGVLEPVLDALLYLHEKGFVHGHVKPSNILIAAGQVKLSGDDAVMAGDVAKPGADSRGLRCARIGDRKADAGGGLVVSGYDTVEALTQRLVVWNWATKGDPAVAQSLPQPFGEIVRECLRTVPTQRQHDRGDQSPALREHIRGGDRSGDGSDENGGTSVGGGETGCRGASAGRRLSRLFLSGGACSAFVDPGGIEVEPEGG